MIEDIVREAGYLTLGSRLKRIGERMQADVQRLCKIHGFDAQASLLPLLAALDKNGTLTVGELVRALGVTQPGVTRSVYLLAAQKLVEVKRAAKDQRCKSVSLTPQGQALVQQSKAELWPQVERAVAIICDGLEGGLLMQLDRLESELMQKPLDQRIENNGPHGSTHPR
jgi:DNA-binding MarR family transcriptional regulator